MLLLHVGAAATDLDGGGAVRRSGGLSPELGLECQLPILIASPVAVAVHGIGTYGRPVLNGETAQTFLGRLGGRAVITLTPELVGFGGIGAAYFYGTPMPADVDKAGLLVEGGLSYRTGPSIFTLSASMFFRNEIALQFGRSF